MSGRRARLVALLLVVALAASGCASAVPRGSASPAAVSVPTPGSSGPVPGSADLATATPSTVSPAPSAGRQSATGSSGATVALAVVTGFSNYLVDSVTLVGLAGLLSEEALLVPCGAEPGLETALGMAGAASGRGAASGPGAACLPADAIRARLPASSTTLALLPPGLVTPAMRVVPIGSADLFGETPARTAPYPLAIPMPAGWPASWTAYDAGNVRVVLTTGVNCPDRGVSYQTNVLHRGWDWLLRAGTARYTGRHWDPAFGWWVVDAVRTDHGGALWNLVRNADIAVSDFECSMTSHFTQHDSGTVFSIDPRVAPLMARAGFDVATIAADHNTNPGLAAVGETVDLFRANGIAAVGGGRTLAQALRPAVLDVRGLRFGFVGFDAIGGSASATATSPGVAPLTAANARTAIAEARAQGAQVVFALPQWSSVEYRAAFTGFQESLIAELVAAGADHIIGADFHWAGAISITPGSRSGYRFVTASQGNFWFGQDWSRQTQEGVMTMLTFVGTRLAQVRLIPTVVLDDAQPNLTDPATDGQFVLHQVLSVSRLLRP
ncbi:MAG TPA: CapA family protein [Candidatus Acidoferrales bacterium]|nr:CapA family protein [Candidatus Acidoferrales bacterium]